MKLTQTKSSLEMIPAQHGFANVAEFKRAYNKAKKKLSDAEARQIEWKKENEKQEPLYQKMEANAVKEKLSIHKRLDQKKNRWMKEQREKSIKIEIAYNCVY